MSYFLYIYIYIYIYRKYIYTSQVLLRLLTKKENAVIIHSVMEIHGFTRLSKTGSGINIKAMTSRLVITMKNYGHIIIFLCKANGRTSAIIGYLPTVQFCV